MRQVGTVEKTFSIILYNIGCSRIDLRFTVVSFREKKRGKLGDETTKIMEHDERRRWTVEYKTITEVPNIICIFPKGNHLTLWQVTCTDKRRVFVYTCMCATCTFVCI